MEEYMTINKEYWSALERLKNNTPSILPKGSKINNDNVAMEAGRKKGTIKKSRESFSELIDAIQQTAQEIAKKKPNLKNRLLNERSQKEHYKALYHEGLNRKLMLIAKLAQLEKQLNSHGNVSPIK